MSLGIPNVSALQALPWAAAVSQPGRAIGINKTPGQQERKGVGVGTYIEMQCKRRSLAEGNRMLVKGDPSCA